MQLAMQTTDKQRPTSNIEQNNRIAMVITRSFIYAPHCTVDLSQTKEKAIQWLAHEGRIYVLVEVGKYMWSAGEDNVVKVWMWQVKRLLWIDALTSHLCVKYYNT